MCNDFWSHTVHFEAISYSPEYKGRNIVTSLSWQELFCCIGLEMLSNDCISLIRAGVSSVLYGESSSYRIREFDFNYLLLILSKNKMLKLDNEKAVLSENGKSFLSENVEKLGLDFFTKRRKEFEQFLRPS